MGFFLIFVDFTMVSSSFPVVERVCFFLLVASLSATTHDNFYSSMQSVLLDFAEGSIKYGVGTPYLGTAQSLPCGVSTTPE